MTEERFKLVSEYEPSGDQPEAIAQLYDGVERGDAHQTLLGVTGSGKTFTIACLVEKINRPTLVMSPNKTLAAQLYSEFRELFPGNAVEYFVSYYDYYQPEAYIPSSDTYIEKDSHVNDEIDKLRHSEIIAVNHQVYPVIETLLLRFPDIEAGKGPHASLKAALAEAARNANGVFRRYNEQVARWEDR